MKAHLNVQQQNEHVVVDCVFTENKVNILIHELISIEHWKLHIYPGISKDLIKADSVKTYFLVMIILVLVFQDSPLIFSFTMKQSS